MALSVSWRNFPIYDFSGPRMFPSGNQHFLLKREKNVSVVTVHLLAECVERCTLKNCKMIRVIIFTVSLNITLQSGGTMVDC